MKKNNKAAVYWLTPLLVLLVLLFNTAYAHDQKNNQHKHKSKHTNSTSIVTAVQSCTDLMYVDLTDIGDSGSYVASA